MGAKLGVVPGPPGGRWLITRLTDRTAEAGVGAPRRVTLRPMEGTDGGTTILRLPVAPTVKWLWWAGGVVVALHLASWWALHLGVAKARVIHLLFDLRGEGNLSAYYAALLLLTGGIVALLIARGGHAQGVMRRGWWLLALVLLFLSADEAGQVHEKFNKSMGALVGEGHMGTLHFAWVLPYAVLTAVFALVSVPWLRALPARTRRGLLVAGAVYVAGALGMEPVESMMVHMDQGSPAVVLSCTLEESLELAGLTLCLAVLLDHLRRTVPQVLLRLDP